MMSFKQVAKISQNHSAIKPWKIVWLGSPIVHAGGLALLGVWASAGTIVTNIVSRVYTHQMPVLYIYIYICIGLAFDGLTIFL